MTIESTSTRFNFAQVPILLRGEVQPIQLWIARWSATRMVLYVAIVCAGTAMFGAAVGSWHDPLQALYTAIKFPLIVLLTALGNGLLNGMLAPLLGINISFRQSMLAVLMSFTIAATILGAFSPLVGFLIWNAPALAVRTADAANTHSFILVTVVALIAMAGIAANIRLLQLLRQLSGSAKSARRTLLAWLAGNLLLGSQVSWILRPFVGSPSLPVEFVRRDALHGNFFESIFHALQKLFS
jgi:hypothetical protein